MLKAWAEEIKTRCTELVKVWDMGVNILKITQMLWKLERISLLLRVTSQIFLS